MVFVFALLGALISVPAFATCGEADTAPDSDVGGEDCDGDGWSKAQGDCDDESAAANPGRGEDCRARGDEDCDGLFDEGCEDPLLGATLEGGSACSPGSGAGVASLLAAALAARRRRR